MSSFEQRICTSHICRIFIKKSCTSIKMKDFNRSKYKKIEKDIHHTEMFHLASTAIPTLTD